MELFYQKNRETIKKRLTLLWDKEILDRTCQWLDRAIYHLDGMEQIRHIDALMSVKKLDMIQWTQVDGQPDLTHNFDSLKKIRKPEKDWCFCPVRNN